MSSHYADNKEMLKQLRSSLKVLKKAQSTRDTLVNQLIEQLPENKKQEAIMLINKAKKGKVDTDELLKFAEGVRDIDKKEFEKMVEKAVDKVNNK